MSRRIGGRPSAAKDDELPYFLNCRKKQADQNRDRGDNYKQFDESEAIRLADSLLHSLNAISFIFHDYYSSSIS